MKDLTRIEFRTQLCHALIAAGEKDSNIIINEVSALEHFIFSEVHGSDKNITTLKTSTNEVKHTAKDLETQVLQNINKIQKADRANELEDSITFDDVKATLMQVAKRSRDKLIEILNTFGTDKVTGIKETDYRQALSLAEEFLGIVNTQSN